MAGNVEPLFPDLARPPDCDAQATAAPRFEAFWALYPRKVARAHAAQIWARLTAAERAAALAALPAHVAAWEAEGRERSRIPHAGTWLHPRTGRRWEDELAEPDADVQAIAGRVARRISSRGGGPC